MNKRKKSVKRRGIKHSIIKKQIKEIELLKDTISNLEIDCKEKDEIVGSIDLLRKDMIEVVNELKDKKEKYDELIEELTYMKRVINEEVFKGKWSLIKFLIR